MQHLIYALESHLFSAFTSNHLLYIYHYFTLRFVSAFEDATHTFLWFSVFFRTSNSHGYWIPSMDVLRSTE